MPSNVVARKPELLVDDATLDDSDKTFTVPEGEEWEILWVYASLTTTATVGSRRLQIRIASGATTLLRLEVNPAQAASLFHEYAAAPGVPMTGLVGGMAYMPIPPNLIVVAGDGIRVLDGNAIAAAADDLTVRIFGFRSVVRPGESQYV